MYQTIAVNIVGSSNPSRSKAFTQERTLNMYPEPSSSGAYPSVLYPWPGSELWSDNNANGTARGLFVTSTGILYKVVNTTLYKIDKYGTQTSIGTILGTDQVIFSDDGNYLVMATKGNGYIYDGTTLSTVSDADYEPGGSVAVLNNQTIWQGNDQRFAVSAAGNPDNIDGLDYATAESSGDSLRRVYVYRETLYLMGSRTTESWYNSGVGSPPFDRIQSGKMEVGIISRTAVSSNDNAMYWVGDDKNLYQATAYTPTPLMTPSIHKEFQSYDLTDCRVQCINKDGLNFILILTGSKTWVYCENTGAWFELAYKAAEETYIANSYVYAYGKHLIQSRVSGEVLCLSNTLFKDDNQIVIRERITAPINGQQLGIDGGRFTAKRAEIITESGIGNLDEPDPVFMMSHSIDFGQSWSKEQFIKAGRNSQNNIRLEYYFLASFRQIQFRIRTSDPNFFSLQSLALDVRGGGRY